MRVEHILRYANDVLKTMTSKKLKVVIDGRRQKGKFNAQQLEEFLQNYFNTEYLKTSSIAAYGVLRPPLEVYYTLSIKTHIN